MASGLASALLWPDGAERAASPSTVAIEATPVDVSERTSRPVDLRKLFDSSSLSDVKLHLQGCDGSAFLKAHKLVLVASCTYFASLFSDPWRPTSSEKSDAAEVVIEVPSAEKLAHLQSFFAFLYGCDVELSLGSAHPLLRLADFYGVDSLSSIAMEYLERVLHPEPTRCFALFPPDASSEPAAPAQPRLLALCTEVLARSFSDAASHEAFIRCPVELLFAVLERDDLAVDREAQVLSALLAWAAHEPSRAGAIGPLLALIRWPMMDGELLADIEDSHSLLASDSARPPLREHLLEALKWQAASPPRKAAITQAASAEAARRFRQRTPNMVRLQGEGKFCWSLKNFSRLAADERIYSPPFCFSGIAFMLLFFPRGNQQREYASLYVSVADKTKLQPGWRREVHFSLCVVDQKESLCSVTKSTHGELSNHVLDWGFTELLPLATLHSSNHGYVHNDTLQFTIQFERVTEGGSVSGRHGRSSNAHSVPALGAGAPAAAAAVPQLVA